MFEGKQARVLNVLRNSRLAQISTALIVLLVVLFSVAVIRAKTFNVEIDNRTVHLTTTWRTVGEALAHSSVGLYEEDIISPDRNTPVTKGLKVQIVRSIPFRFTLDGKMMEVRSPSATVGEALEDLSKQYSLNLKESDEVNVARKTTLPANMDISVQRSIPVELKVDGYDIKAEIAPRTVAKALEKLNITLGELDKVSLPLDHQLQANDVLQIARVAEKVEKVQSSIPYKVIAQAGNFPVGLPDRLVSQGTNGLQEQTVKVTSVDGKEATRVVLDQRVVKEPVNQVVSRGTVNTVSRGGSALNFTKAYQMKATAYSAPGGRTASGAATGWGVVAVDPNVIPLGTRLYVEGYGEAVALDTGSAIKGNTIDLHMSTLQECISWGARYVTVYVLK